MTDYMDKEQFLIAKYRRFVATAGGGIFNRKVTRERLLGIRSLSGRDRTKNDFWYDVRNRVRTALKDLEFFIDAADAEQRDQVLTRESVEPLFNALFYFHPKFPEKEPNATKAEIAYTLIQEGFRYLEGMTKDKITLSNERTIKEALDVSDFLLSTIKGTEYSRPAGFGEF